MELDLESMRNSNEFLNALYNDVTSAIFLADSQARIHHFNDPFKTLFRLPEDEVLRRHCGNVIGCAFTVDEGCECGETSNCSACPLRSDIIRSFTMKVPVYKDSLTREFVIAGERVVKHFCFTTKYAEYRGQEFVLVVVDDVSAIESARREAEKRGAKLESELRANAVELLCSTKELAELHIENEELCREIRHRVGNNMQVISSLLYLESFEGAERRSRSLKNRIEAIVGVYSNSRYEEGGTSSVKVLGLLEFIIDMFSDAGRIEVESIPEQMCLGIDASVSFALAVEDIISYIVGPFGARDAPGGSPAPEIALSLKAGDDGSIAFSARMTDPHGRLRAARDLLLARSMAHQLGGSLEMMREFAEGSVAETRFELRFRAG